VEFIIYEPENYQKTDSKYSLMPPTSHPCLEIVVKYILNYT